MSNVSNILAIARREFTVRVRSRSYRLGTAVLVIGVLGFAFLPVIGRLVAGGQAQKIAIHVDAANVTGDPAQTLSAILNSSKAQGVPGAPSYVVTAVADIEAMRSAVTAGTYDGGLEIGRSGAGDLTFSFLTKDTSALKTAVLSALVQQAAQALTIADRLARLGIQPGEQQTLFAPVAFDVQASDPTDVGPGSESFLLGFGLTILIFLMVILYGSWIAFSVVEEKSSRVIEVVLNAATPFQLLAGKVVGVGALALVQYIVILIAGGVAIVLSGPIASRLLGDASAGVGVPAGLNAWILLLLLVYGVLGFMLYSVLFAAAASLVSRQEDVQQSVMPMTLIATAGYMVAVYGGTGLLDPHAGWIGAMAQFPLFSPFMMLGRVTGGVAGPVEIALSLVLLVIGIVAALWLAARIYAAGVLLYGQRPSLVRIWRLVRSGA